MGIKDERTDLGDDAKTQMETKIVPSHTCHCSFYLRERQACVSPQEFGKKVKSRQLQTANRSFQFTPRRKLVWFLICQ